MMSLPTGFSVNSSKCIEFVYFVENLCRFVADHSFIVKGLLTVVLLAELEVNLKKLMTLFLCLL